jgi:predicted RNA-binding Zn-ribbon protein involved in translation (DUF1610 family)
MISFLSDSFVIYIQDSREKRIVEINNNNKFSDSSEIENFLINHKVKNLRTLEKAQRFFEDVKLFCKGDKSEQFIEELRLICFAVVVESIENLYYKEINPDSTDHTEEMAFAYEIHCPKCGNHLKQIGRQLTLNTLGLYKCPVCDRN